MQYIMSKDFLKTASPREILFYDSSIYNPPESFGNEYSSSAKWSILLNARATLKNDSQLNTVAGVLSNRLYLTHLRYGIDPDVTTASLDVLCSMDRTDADQAPIVAGSIYSDTAPYNVVLLTGRLQTQMSSDGTDYYFNSTVYGTVTPTFKYVVRLVGGVRHTVATTGSPVGVSPLTGGSRYVGKSTFDTPYAGLGFIGKLKPTYNNSGVNYSSPSKGARLSQDAPNAPDEKLTLDCFVWYDSSTGRFKRYGASYFKIDPYVYPGQSPVIELLTRQAVANVPL